MQQAGLIIKPKSLFLPVGINVQGNTPTVSSLGERRIVFVSFICIP